MSKFDWNDHPIVDPSAKSDSNSFNWNDHPIIQPDKPTMFDSAVRKLRSGSLAGLSDEVAGGAEAAGRMLGLNGVGNAIGDVSSKFVFDPSAIPDAIKKVSLNKDGPTFSMDDIKAAYKTGRDHERQMLKLDSDTNPVTSKVAELTGAVVSPVNKLAKGMSLAKGGALIGGITGFGNSDADNVTDTAIDTAKGAGLGAIAGAAFKKAAPSLAKAGTAIGNKFGSAAENLAENATGATGKQSEKFADDAGRQLLDRKLVRFGDNASNIADRTRGAMNQANADIDSVLKTLDAKGVTASADNVVAELESKISDLAKDPSQANVAKRLKNIVLDITETGNSKIPISVGEQTKRGFNKMAGNWMDPEAGQAGKTAYQAYRGEVEKAAQDAAPELAQKFADAKKTYGVLAPIEEAASRRAATLNQSPIGGLLDVATAGGAGSMVGGPVGALSGVGAAVARKVLAPRAASSAAVTLDKVSQALLEHSPKLAELYQSNPAAFQSVVESTVSNISNKLQIPSLRAASADDKNQASKGPDKWANDGVKNIAAHDSSIDQSTIDKLMKSTSGKDLLIKASDLKPGSKAMDKLIESIKNFSPQSASTQDKGDN